MGVVHGAGGRHATIISLSEPLLHEEAAALVGWQLEAGRPHQESSSYKKKGGHPMLGDGTYGGGGRSAAERLHRKGAMSIDQAKLILQKM